MNEALYRELATSLVRPRLNAPQLNALCELVEHVCQTLSVDERLALTRRLGRASPADDPVRLYSVSFRLTGDLGYLERILHHYLTISDRPGPELLHYTFWCIQRQMFLGRACDGKAATFGPCELFGFYERLPEAVRACWNLRPTAVAAPISQRLRRVAFITNQFLGGAHQPSRDCFDFARRLKKDHGIDTLIVNGNLLPNIAVNFFVPPFTASMVKEFTGLQSVTMFGEKVQAASFTEPAFNRDKLAAIIAMTERFNPDVVVGFGGGNIIADLFAGIRPTLLLPTTTGFICSQADLILGFDRHDWTAEIPALYRRPFAGRFRPFTFGYSLPPTGDDDAQAMPPSGGPVFAVVGTRLDDEVTADFLALLETILGRCPDASVIFAGDAPLLAARLAASPHAGRLIGLGHVKDIRRLYRRCAVYLNPPRQGGGAGAAYALAEGLPVVTLPHGDAASVAGPAAHAADTRAYVERAAALAADPVLRGAAADAARRRFAEIGDRGQAAAALAAYCREAAGLES